MQKYKLSVAYCPAVSYYPDFPYYNSLYHVLCFTDNLSIITWHSFLYFILLNIDSIPLTPSLDPNLQFIDILKLNLSLSHPLPLFLPLYFLYIFMDEAILNSWCDFMIQFTHPYCNAPPIFIYNNFLYTEPHFIPYPLILAMKDVQILAQSFAPLSSCMQSESP